MACKHILFLTLSLSFFISFSQNGEGFFSLRTDYEIAKFKEFQLNDFVRSFNSYYSGFLPQEMDTLTANSSSHFNFGIGGRFTTGGRKSAGFSGGILLLYGTRGNNYKAISQNNITTNMDVRYKDWTNQIDIGFHIRQIAFFHVHMAGRFRNTVIDLGYYYPDGTYSIGGEYDLLGIYSAKTSTLDFGGSIGFKLGPVYVPFTISFPSAFAQFEGVSVTDYDIRQFRWPDLPRDFETWANNPENLSTENGFVRSNTFRTVRMSVAVEILLNKNTFKKKK